MTRRFRFPALLFPLMALAAGCGGGDTPAPATPGAAGTPLALDEISADRMTAHVRFLSHDLLEGRAPATRGGDLAAQYIAAQFDATGLEPAGENASYFQPVPVVESKVDPSFRMSASGGGRSATFAYLDEVVAFSGVEDAVVNTAGDVVFVGYGINAPEANWNDYAGADVRGKIVLALVNDPPATDAEPQLFGGEALTYYGRWTYKFEEAARQGAAGAVLIHTTESAGYPWQVVRSSWSGTQYSLPAEEGQPVLPLKAWVTDEAARSLAGLAGRDLDELRAAAAKRGFTAVPLPVRLQSALRQATARKTSPNVIGVLKGEGPNASQAVIYTAHYDHFGVADAQPGQAADADRIYNGALDNASGVAGMLAVAQAFARAGARPARSIYFVATTAEESGLLGAEYFVRRPPLPIGQVAANINIDSLNIMGPSRDLVLLGAERSSLGDLAAEIVAPHGRVIGQDSDPSKGYFFRSDHFPLAKAGVPAVSISEPTEILGKEPGYAATHSAEYIAKHYHQPSDEFDPAVWDLAGAADDMKRLAELGWRVAAQPSMPRYHESEQFARPRATE